LEGKRIRPREETRFLKRKDLIETMAKNIPAGVVRFGCHIAEIHPSDPGAVLSTSGGGVVRAKASSIDLVFLITPTYRHEYMIHVHPLINLALNSLLTCIIYIYHAGIDWL
jgi:hypothetical protein